MVTYGDECTPKKRGKDWVEFNKNTDIKGDKTGEIKVFVILPPFVKQLHNALNVH